MEVCRGVLGLEGNNIDPGLEGNNIDPSLDANNMDCDDGVQLVFNFVMGFGRSGVCLWWPFGVDGDEQKGVHGDEMVLVEEHRIDDGPVLASRQWNLELSKFLISLGYKQYKNNYSLFIKAIGDSFTAALVYVDDVLLTGNSVSTIEATKVALDSKFTIKDLGLAKYFLGIEICRTDNGTHLNQRKYILDLLHDSGLTATKPAKFPLPQYLKLSVDKGAPLADPESYRRLVGRLLYLTMTRPDISYTVQHLSQSVSSPKEPHWNAALHLLKYLKGSVNKGLFYPVQQHLKVTGFSDADWASFLVTHRSLTSYCIFLGHALVSRKIKKQTTVSRSSTESEYRSMAATTCELLWLTYLLQDFHIPVQFPVTLFCDNKAAQQIAANPCYHDHTKHLDIDCHFTRDKV
ncbi:uncharacterized mitochondrial protein AtMg00810-like [Rutidosis leptorrhynchoides]|uniref:uncharacterized mitochondrial protein AtMg00810-like n=1 Tax=Rutidosis leptorrhynchoides TaxID=125765 RepID=UPI003A995C52